MNTGKFDAAPPPKRQAEDKRTCVMCKAVAPDTNTGYTLISSQHGWRVKAQRGPDGRRYSEWYCPDCWNKRKRASTG